MFRKKPQPKPRTQPLTPRQVEAARLTEQALRAEGLVREATAELTELRSQGVPDVDARVLQAWEALTEAIALAVDGQVRAEHLQRSGIVVTDRAWIERNTYRVSVEMFEELGLQPPPASREGALLRLQEMARTMPDYHGVVRVDDFVEFFRLALTSDVPLKYHPDIHHTMFLGLAKGGAFLRIPSELLLPTGESPIYAEHVCLENASGDILDDGLLTVTDRRIMFEGSVKTLTFQLEKLTSVRARGLNLMLGVGNRQTTSSFMTDEPEYVERLVRELLAHEDRLIINTRLVNPPTGEVTDPY